MYFRKSLVAFCFVVSYAAAQVTEEFSTTSSSIVTTPDTSPTISTTSVEAAPTETSTTSNENSSTIITESPSEAPTASTDVSSTADTSTAELTTNATAIEPPSATLYVDAGGDHEEMPPVELTPEDTAGISTLELETYADFLASNGLPPVSEGAAPIPVVLPNCPPAALIQKRVWPFKDRPKRKPGYNCAPASIDINVHFHLVAEGLYLTFPVDVRRRIDTQMTLLNDVYNRYGISYKLAAEPDMFVNAEFTNYAYDYRDTVGQQIKQRTKDNVKFMKETRVTGREVLNVWLVNDAKQLSGGSLNGHAFYPGSQLFSFDGVVMTIASLAPVTQPTLAKDDTSCSGEKRFQGGTLIHEIGHWMGLIHPFAGDECADGDKITDTFSYENPSGKKYCCQQTQCETGTLRRIQNWMSYSECRGTTKDNSIAYSSFTGGQRSMMYAHFLTFRRGINCGAVFNKRSLSDLSTLSPILRKREEDKVNLLADLLLNNCSVAIQDVFEEETIPLAKEVLTSLSSAASSLQASPTVNNDPNNPRPTTVNLGTATARASDISEASASGGASGGGSSGGSSGNTSGAEVAGMQYGWSLFGSMLAIGLYVASMIGL